VYDFVKPLGSGTFGVVREVKSKNRKNRRAPSHFAVKTIPNTADTEMALMQKLEHHPHVLRLEHVILEEQEIHLVMSICRGGDLQNWIEERWDDEFTAGTKYYDAPGTSEVAVLSRQMLSAVAYIHHLSIVHRDIKPANWLLSGGFFPVLKLSDFGLGQEMTHPGEVMKKACGSSMYMAPEVFSGCYTELCDVWSSAMVIFELVCGKPFFGHLPERQLEQAVYGEMKLDQADWEHQRPWLKTWLQSLLVKEVDGRPSASKALNHPEVQNARWNGKCNCTVS
ncbi:unnamed protein product, partial [Cladocopium goreaui]